MESSTNVALPNQDTQTINDSSTSLLQTHAPTQLDSSVAPPNHRASPTDDDSKHERSRKDTFYTQSQNTGSTLIPSTMDVEKQDTMDMKRYKSLVKQFNVKVALSTFACSLIVAHASLINAIISTRYPIGKGELGNGIPHDIGLLFSFLAIAFHAGSIIISGRGAVLCSDPDAKGRRPVKYFDETLVLCEHLHLDGTIFFVLAVFVSSFLVFNHVYYPLIFCALSLLGVALFFAGKYREVSVTYKDFVLIRNWAQKRMGKSKH